MGVVGRARFDASLTCGFTTIARATDSARRLNDRSETGKSPIRGADPETESCRSALPKQQIIEGNVLAAAYGYSPDHDVQRYYRDAPLLAIGEGTNEMQRIIIARQLVQRESA